MNCIYMPELIREMRDFQIPHYEIKHIKALRIDNAEKVIITNGNGLSAIGNVDFINKNTYSFHPEEFFDNYGENSYHSSIAIGILDNKERFEFALEKSVELGINEFFPLITKYSQRIKVNLTRLNTKAISAMKQCCRSILPKIHTPVTIKQLIKDTGKYKRIILADINGGELENLNKNTSTLVIVGPEGGFSNEEVGILKANPKVRLLNLGNRRLRAETAAIVSLGLLI